MSHAAMSKLLLTWCVKVHSGFAIMKKIILLFFCCTFAGIAVTQGLPNAPSAQKSVAKQIANDTGWPRTFKSGQQEFIVYQPQVDRWDGNRIYLYSAVELK